MVNGQNMTFDTFSSPGSYSLTGAGVSYLIFSYDCTGNMRWAKQIGTEEGDFKYYDIKTDPQGNSYFTTLFAYGNYNGQISLHLGDTTILPPFPFYIQPYVCTAKFDSMGKLVWFRHYDADTVDHSALYNHAYGLRIGSSGNLWISVMLDSNYALTPTFHSIKKGHYIIQINPTNGDIISGYYAANNIMLLHTLDPNYSWSIDENENYYECGNIFGDFGSGGDTLILSNSHYTDDTSKNNSRPYIFSLSKTGAFRFLISDTSHVFYTQMNSCNYDPQSHQIVSCLNMDTIVVFGHDTAKMSSHFTQTDFGKGLLSINTNGNVKWCKNITASDEAYNLTFQFTPLPDYIWSMPTNGTIVYNNHDTITTGTGSCPYNCSHYYSVTSRIDSNGNILQNFTADLGTINQNVFGGGDAIRSGAKDWRGNAYLGGSITNYMNTSAGNVTNTDGFSGNFFIAKIGTSSCTCPTPGVTFTLTSAGDTIHVSGTTTSQHDSIIWHYGDGASGKGDALNHIYAHDGTYTITAIAYNNCGRDSLTRQVTVTSACSTPGVSFTQIASGDTLRTFAATTAHADSVVWHFGDGATATHDTAQHIYTHDGTYTVTVIAYNSCGSDTATRQVTVNTVGIIELKADQTHIYPNPTGGGINVAVSAAAEIGLVNASGSMMWTAPKTLSQAGTYVFDLSEYANGIYYCVVAYSSGKTEVIAVSKK